MSGSKEDIAYCGLDCGRCPAFLATRRGDREALAETAERWSAESGEAISAGSIICDGCRGQSGRINEFCAVCEIRKCAVGRGLDTCAGCELYPCRRLLRFAPYESEGRSNLDRLRSDT